MSVLAGTDVVEQARVDERPRARRMLAPMLTLGGSALALGYLRFVDPNNPGHYPVCPTRALFGIDCPGCGGLRATHDLLCGDVAGALDHNVLIVVFIPVAIFLWVRWALRAWRGRTPQTTVSQFRRRNQVMIVALVLLLVFGVVRNFVPYLGSGLG